MKTLPALFRAAVFLALSIPTLSLAEDLTPPVVANPIADIVVPVNSAPTKVDFKKTFGLAGVTGKLVRMNTDLGKIDLELFSDAAPRTVDNFLNYANSENYDNTIFHRSTTLDGDGLAIIQAGDTVLQGSAYSAITSFGNVPNEYNLPNARGTVAMAKLGGQPDSATSQWFINVSDNSTTLDANNNGGFTVFARVVGRGMETADAISALKTYDLSNVRFDWNTLPLHDYDESQPVTAANLVTAGEVALLPVTSKGKGFPGAILVKLKGNTNPDLVTATVKNRKLILAYKPGQTGVAVITLQAKGAGKSKTTHTFNVTVQ